LKTPYVIHAVGPNFWDYVSDSYSHEDNRAGVRQANDLLESAYRRSLELASEHGIRQVAFSLLSAGVYRGPLPLETILEVSVRAIVDWAAAAAKEEATTAVAATTDSNGDGSTTMQVDDSKDGADEEKGFDNKSDRMDNNKAEDGEAVAAASAAVCGSNSIDNCSGVCPAPVEVTLCAFSPNECEALMRICDETLGLVKLPSPPPPADSAAGGSAGDTDEENDNDDGGDDGKKSSISWNGGVGDSSSASKRGRDELT